MGRSDEDAKRSAVNPHLTGGSADQRGNNPVSSRAARDIIGAKDGEEDKAVHSRHRLLPTDNLRYFYAITRIALTKSNYRFNWTGDREHLTE